MLGTSRESERSSRKTRRPVTKSDVPRRGPRVFRKLGATPAADAPSAAPSRPFSAGLWRKSKQVAHRYRVIIEPDDRGVFYGRALEIPTVFARGDSPEECLRETLEALTLAVATLLESGRKPPAPGAADARKSQINIRVSADEKLLLEAAAQRSGYRGVSDFLRAAGLSAVREGV